MNQHSFTAALAEQHRADLMTAAQHARDCRRATGAGTRSRKLRSWRAPLRISWTFGRQTPRLRESF